MRRYAERDAVERSRYAHQGTLLQRCRVCGQEAHGYHLDSKNRVHKWKHTRKVRGRYRHHRFTETSYCELPIDKITG